jgi:hypothetical protein
MSVDYFDAGVVAKRYLRDPDSDEVDAWLAEPAHRHMGRAAMIAGLRVKSFQAQIAMTA